MRPRILCALALFACGAQENESSAARTALEERLSAARTDASELEQGLAALPDDTSECSAASDRVAGPNVWSVDGEHHSARLAAFEEQADELRGELDELSEQGASRWLDRISNLARYELVVIADEYTEPAVDLTTHGFEAGTVHGRALLWDHDENRWVCAVGAVHAESSPDLTLSYSAPVTGPEDPQALGRRLQRQLDEDFAGNVQREALAALREPPPIEAPAQDAPEPPPAE